MSNGISKKKYSLILITIATYSIIQGGNVKITFYITKTQDKAPLPLQRGQINLQKGDRKFATVEKIWCFFFFLLSKVLTKAIPDSNIT